MLNSVRASAACLELGKNYQAGPANDAATVPPLSCGIPAACWGKATRWPFAAAGSSGLAVAARLAAC